MEKLGLWLLTYLLHSSVLLGAAALLRLALGGRRLGLQEAVLRASLLGGFVTASLQLGLGVRPLLGSVTVPEVPGTVATASAAPADVARPAEGGGQLVDPRDAVRVEQAHGGGWARRAARLWRPLLAVGWGTLALVGALRFVVAARRLRRLLRDRRPLSELEVGPHTWEVAGALGLGGRVRLSTAPRLVVPLATGVLRPEVCLPVRALEELPAEERIALCAHEMAHLARRDPAWILVARLVEAMAPLQPLNTWARRRLQDLAECLSDDLAVAVSGRPLGLARSLVDIASWAAAQAVVHPGLAAGALSARSRVGHRVERLMDPLRALERPRRLLLALAAVTVLATVLVTPIVSGGARQEPERPSVVPQTTPDAAPRTTPEAMPLATPQPSPQPAPHPRPRPEPDQGVKDGAEGDAVGGVTGDGTDADRASHARRELERVTEQIEGRSRAHEAEMKRLEAEIDALASGMRPNEQEMERLGHEIEKAAREMADIVTAGEAGGHDAAAAEKMAEARRRVQELTAEMKANAHGVRLPEEELRQLQEKARALAELARPTEQEMRDLHRAARELARESMPDREEMARMVREAVAQARATADAARQEARRAHEEARRAAEELKKALDDKRRAQEQAHGAKESEKP
jgi:beta-lactamase regulating signal transducer with metallopeptidase domain